MANAELPKSLLTDQHKDWLHQAQQVLTALNYHIDQAERAGIPGMDEHRKKHAEMTSTIGRILNTYFPHG